MPNDLPELPAAAPDPAPAPAPAADPAPAPAATPEPTAEEFLRYDPFAPGGGSQPASASTPASQETPVGLPSRPGAAPMAPQSALPPVAPATATPTVPDPTDRIASALDRLLEAKAAPAPVEEPASAEPPLPEYAFTLPPQLVQMLESEDPAQRHQGIAMAMRGTAVTVHQMMRREMAETIGRITESLPQIIQGQVAEHRRAESIYNDFYGKFPELAAPALRSVVSQVANTVMDREFKGQPWTPQSRDRIGTVLRQLLASASGVSAPASQPQPTVPVVTAQPPNFGGMRGAPGRVYSNEEKQILDILAL